MKLLSEIEMDDYIVVDNIENGIMTKEDYLNSDAYKNNEISELFETEINALQVSWRNIIEQFEDDQYYDWTEDVLNDIDSYPELKTALETLNGIFKRNPTYYESAPIINDLLDSE